MKRPKSELWRKYFKAEEKVHIRPTVRPIVKQNSTPQFITMLMSDITNSYFNNSKDMLLKLQRNGNTLYILKSVRSNNNNNNHSLHLETYKKLWRLQREKRIQNLEDKKSTLFLLKTHNFSET